MDAPFAKSPPVGLPPASAQQHDDEPAIGFDLSRYWVALRKYAWALAALVALAIVAAVLYTERVTKIYQATASLQIDPRLPDLLGQGQEMLSSGAVGATAEYYKQQVLILSSYALARKTVDRKALQTRLLSDKARAGLSQEEQIDLATRVFQEMVTVKYPEQNRTLYVTVRSPSAKDAAEFANLHVKTFEDYSRGELSDSTGKASDALRKEFAKAEASLKESEEKLQKFLADYKIEALSLQDQQNLKVADITGFTQKLNDAKARRLDLGKKLDEIRKASKLDVLDSPLLTIADVSSFDSLRAQFYTERNALKAMANELGPKTLEYRKQKDKVDDLMAAMQAEAKRQLAGAESQYNAALNFERALQNEVSRAQQEAVELKPKIDMYNDLQRNRQNFEDRYKILVSKLSTTVMTGNINEKIGTNVHPLDPALVPTKPVSPNLRSNVAIASLGSLALGLGLIALLVFMDRTVKSTADAQQAAGVPVLGIIPALAESDLPDNDRARDMYVHEHPTSRIAECCRALRTNIMFSAAERKLKTIVVSSANPREGKTTSVIYLGTTLAQSGQRVLLIDTDMRRPRLHMSTGVPRNTGLSNLILGDENYEDACKPTDVPNLFVLPCGPQPPNPAELLMTKRFGVVIEELAKRFDRIILDSPPIGPVTDAVVLSKQVDGAIMVVRAGKTLREDIRRAAKAIHDVNGGIFGVIVNELDGSDKGGYYYSYYGYYGNDENDPDKKAKKAA